MTKEEKIQEAYGKTHSRLKLNIDTEGWCRNESFAPNTDLLDLLDSYEIKRWVRADMQGNLIFRPCALDGIENNNGWVKIESEADYPKKDLVCWLIDEEFGEDVGIFLLNFNKFYTGNVTKIPTHYQPITKPKPPVY